MNPFRKAAVLAGILVGMLGGAGVASAQTSIGVRIGNVSIGYSDHGYRHVYHPVYYHPYHSYHTSYVVEEPVRVYHPYRHREYREYVPYHRHW